MAPSVRRSWRNGKCRSADPVRSGFGRFVTPVYRSKGDNPPAQLAHMPGLSLLMPARWRYAFRPTSKASARWMNDSRGPPASPDEQADLLTRAGLRQEEREQITLPAGGTDVRQDIELTS